MNTILKVLIPFIVAMMLAGIITAVFDLQSPWTFIVGAVGGCIAGVIAISLVRNDERH